MENIIKKNINKISTNDYVIKFIEKNSCLIIDKYFNEFLKTDEYNNLNKNHKTELFQQVAFFNSCKSYSNIKILKDDFKQISLNFPRNDNNIEFYYNIIFQYLINLFTLVNNKKFYLDLENIKELKKLLEYLNISNLSKENKIFQQLQKILTLLENKIFSITNEIKKSEIITECIELIKKKLKHENKSKNEININEEDINSSKDDETNVNSSNVNINFGTFDKNDKIENNSNRTSLNDATIIDNTISYNSDNPNNSNESNNDKEKHKFNYEQLMCPPILDDNDF